jgi:hypothetical protein
MSDPSTAVHSVVVGQEMESTTIDRSEAFQSVPPSEVVIIPEPPPAKQTEGVGQEMDERASTPAGAACVIHVVPRLIVPMMVLIFPLSSPTASQSVLLPHETD